MASPTPYILTSIGDYAINDLPNTTAISFGDTVGAAGINMTDIGTLGRMISGPGINPAGTGSDYVVAIFMLPALSFGSAGRGILLEAGGGFASNTNTKRCKLYWNPTAPVVGSVVSGGTVIADTGNYAVTGAVGWSMAANVFKYGALGSNTQLGIHLGAQIGATVGSLVAPLALTANESGAIYVALTANAATAATDITANFLFINGVN